MEKNELEIVKERGENIFSVLNNIFEFGSFLDKDDQETLKGNIYDYDKRREKVKNSKDIILSCFYKALNKVIPKNKKYKIEEIEELFSKIEFFYNLNVFQYHKSLKFILGFPLFYSYISKIQHFSKKWRDILFPFDLELDFIRLKINGSFNSFYKNNKEKFDEMFLNNNLRTIKNWKNGKNLISSKSIYKAIKSFKNLSQEEEEFFQILYIKRIIWKIYNDMEKDNKEQLKQFVRIFFKVIYIFSFQDENTTDDEGMEKFLEIISDELNIRNEEKELFLENLKKNKNLEKNIENLKIDFEKACTNTINRMRFNNENIYKFNDDYNALKKNYELHKHKELLEKIEKEVHPKNYYEYNYFIYFLVDSYNLLDLKKAEYKNQELRDSKRFLEQLEKYYEGKIINNKIILEYREKFKGEIRNIGEIFNIILENLFSLDVIIEIFLNRISSNEKLTNKFTKYIGDNFMLPI